MGLVREIGRLVERVGVTAQNAMEVARFGGFLTDDQSTPYEVVAEVGIARLRRYAHPDGGGVVDGPPIVLLPPLMMTAEVWDVSPATSAVRAMLAAGVDPWVVDFGSPEQVAGGLERTLADHVLAVAGAVEEVRGATGHDVHLAGYSQGGMFAYQAAAFRRSDGVASLVTFGSPVDVHSGVPFGLPQAELTRAVARLAETVFGSSAVPGWMTRTGFKLLDPVKTVRSRIEFLLQLHDRERLLEREPQRRFLDGEGFIAWPGPALAEFASQFVAHNRMLAGGFVIDDRPVTLADITCPTLVVVGSGDDIAPPATVRAIEGAAPGADVRELVLPTGHFGLVVGSRASAITWPTVASWITWLDGGADPGAEADAAWGPVDHDASGDATFGPTPSDSAQLLLDSGTQLTRAWVRLVTRGVRTVSDLTDEAVELLPRMLRLERVDRDTRVSLALLLDERADEAPEGTFFLHEDRAYSWSAAKHRIDAVVRGLLELGVRQGEHVAVLMDTRPSALALVAALNRLGAVAVLLRPHGEPMRELELGRARRLVVDPTHRDLVHDLDVDLPVAVLGGGGQDRDLGPGVVDMERIDPDAVELPGWYRPNPGRAGELAFVLFAGRGERTRVNRILNGRWALSAFGTASAGRLGERDTMFGSIPVHHPSGLLTAIGGAVAGGARLALPGADAQGFWTESRRTGATVVSYTWASLRDAMAAPRTRTEQGSPIRLFVGSGMPVGLWRRVLARVPDATVLEFYASTEGGVVLANVTGEKVGCKGRPLPGSARTALAAWDLDRDRLVVGDDGFARACRTGEPGMLLAATDAGASSGRTSPLRGVFRHRDAWLPTGDLMWQDEDGDHWLLGSTSSLVHTARGAVAPVPIEDRLGLVDAVDLVTVYGVPDPGDEELQRAVAAVTLHEGATLDADEVTERFAGSDPGARPDAVRVVDDLATTAWHRVDATRVRAEGLPRHRRAAPVFRWVEEDQRFRPR